MCSRLYLVPQKKFGIIIFSNRYALHVPDAVGFHLIDYLQGGGIPKNFESYTSDWLDLFYELAKTMPIEEEQRSLAMSKQIQHTKPSFPLSTYAGTYTCKIGGNVKITLQDNKLGISFCNTPRLQNGVITHFHYETFLVQFDKYLKLDALVTFHQDYSAKIISCKFQNFFGSDWTGGFYKIFEFVKIQ